MLHDLCFRSIKIHGKSILKSEGLISIEFRIEVTSEGGRVERAHSGPQRTGDVLFLKWIIEVCFILIMLIFYSLHNKCIL